MTREVFLDSSAIFAWSDLASRDGQEVESFIEQGQASLVTTNLIVAETLSLVTKRVGKFKGIEVGEKLENSSIVQVVHLDEKIQKEAWQLYKKYKDKDFDLIDATSFVFCQKRKIHEVLTLDHHFAQMGFKVYPL